MKKRNRSKMADTFIVKNAKPESDPENNLSAQIAVALKEVREQAGLSKQELADKIGSTAMVISRLETISFKQHSFEMVEKVLKALGKNIDFHYSGKDFHVGDYSPLATSKQSFSDEPYKLTGFTKSFESLPSFALGAPVKAESVSFTGKNYGWICPKCDRALAPLTTSCFCK